MADISDYTFRVGFHAASQQHQAHCAEFPTMCCTNQSDSAAALAEIKSAVSDHIDQLILDGKPVPPPMNLGIGE